ncbi:hypothetical protein YC2023_103320 [Brassica napus]
MDPVLTCISYHLDDHKFQDFVKFSLLQNCLCCLQLNYNSKPVRRLSHDPTSSTGRFDLVFKTLISSEVLETWSNEILKGRFATPCHFEVGLIGVLLKRRKIRRYSSDAPFISFSPLRSP